MLSDLINNRTLVLEGSQKARASLVVQMVKNLPAVRETWVQSLGWEDSPVEGKDYPLQHSGLQNTIHDHTVHGVAESDMTQ